MSEIILSDSVDAPEVEQQEQAFPGRQLNVMLTFTEEGVKIDVKSNLSALEQLGAIEVFKAHLLSSALGSPNE
jgi:hypothetical protein